MGASLQRRELLLEVVEVLLQLDELGREQHNALQAIEAANILGSLCLE